LAAARGKGLQHGLSSAGGASLRTHWNAGEALQAIQAGRYDRVVLQEQSTLPVKNARRMHENVRLFDGAIKAAGARFWASHSISNPYSSLESECTRAWVVTFSWIKRNAP
jgi:hypothetical protein